MGERKYKPFLFVLDWDAPFCFFVPLSAKVCCNKFPTKKSIMHLFLFITSAN